MTNISIIEIIKIEGLSQKIAKTCKELNINTINELFKYYYENKTFRYKRICGTKTNQDIINIIHVYSKIFPEEIKKIKKVNEIKNLKETINQIKWEYYNKN